MHTYIYIHKHKYTYVYAYTHLYKHRYIYVCTYIETYILAYTYVYLYICTWERHNLSQITAIPHNLIHSRIIFLPFLNRAAQIQKSPRGLVLVMG